VIDELKKALVLLCGPPLSAVGGGPTHIRNMLASPLQNDYRLVHFESGSRGVESPARDEGMPFKAFRIVTSPFVLGWKIMRLRPAIVHLNSALDHKAFWRDLVYLLVCKILFRKVVLQFHGGSLRALCGGVVMRLAVRLALAIPDAVVMLATSEKRDLEMLGITSRVAIIRNGVDMLEYRCAGERVHSGRVRRMVFMGRLIRPKGIFEAMEAVQLLRAEKDFKDVELWIAGSGPERNDIERWIREHTMDGCVRLVGSIYGQDKIEFLREADVFVFPTYHQEGLPYAILESLAAGTPVIASKVAGIPDVVADRVHGILIDAKDPRQIVGAVHELALSEDGLRAMSRNCRAWAVQELGLDRLATQFGDLYERIRA
jgi:glycosyltransferase involved in cell wall biosynthesis